MSGNLVALMVLATSGDPRLLQGEKYLEAKDCDGFHSLFSKVKPEKAERDLAYARLLVRGAMQCRPKDKVLALAMTERALSLAPDDYGIQTAHAEGLLELDQDRKSTRLN